MNNISRYLEQLKIEQAEPNLNYLQRLIQHHLSLIPYETFSKFHYFMQKNEAVPDFSVFLDNMEKRGWGGTCYSLNINFARLLREMGYSCDLVRVNPGHAAIMVRIKGKKYYVDVGYGSPLIRPIELEGKSRQVLHGFGEEIIFTKQNEQLFLLERRSNGKTFATKKIVWTPLTEAELKRDIAASFEDDDCNVTMRRITAVRFHGNECYFLRDRTLKIMSYRDIREHQLRDKDQWKRVVADAFQVDELGMEEALAFLEKRGIGLFVK